MNLPTRSMKDTELPRGSRKLPRMLGLAMLGLAMLGPVGAATSPLQAQDQRPSPPKPAPKGPEQALGELGPETEANAWAGRAGKHLITERDLIVQWELSRAMQPLLEKRPSARQRLELLKDIVEDYLWIDRAKSFEQYPEIVTRKHILNRARSVDPELWDREDLSEEWRRILERRAETSLAQWVLLMSDPEYKRSMEIVPEDLREIYRLQPDRFVEREEVLMARVGIVRNIRAGARELADQVRSEALQEGGLEAAAERLAKGTYRAMEWETLQDSDLLEEILDFARAAKIGDISPVFEGRSSYTVYEMVDRKAKRTVPFTEAAPRLRHELERKKQIIKQNEFLIRRLLLKADYEPSNLFDSHLGR